MDLGHDISKVQQVTVEVATLVMLLACRGMSGLSFLKATSELVLACEGMLELSPVKATLELVPTC